MLQAAKDLRFEEAASLRDYLVTLQRQGIAGTTDVTSEDI